MAARLQESIDRKRLIDEQLSQMLMVFVSLLDRIVLTAVIFRLWDTSMFEVWSSSVAAAGLITLFEIGFNLYFNNRLMIETEGGKPAAARQSYFLCNSILGTSSIFGFLFIALFALFFQPSDHPFASEAAWVVLILSAGGAARIAVSGAYSLYRANRQYARLVKILAAGELLRILSAILTLLSGGGMIAVSVVSTFVQVLVTVLFVVIDTNRRFSPHTFGFSFPRWSFIREAVSMSSAFYSQMVSVILLTSLPVLVLNSHDLAVGLLAAFVLLRTLSGLSRAPLQAMGVVLGQECGRLIAMRDFNGAFLIFSEGARLFAVFSGFAAGFLIVGGGGLVKAWTGDNTIFDPYLLIAAVAPMIVASTSILAHNVLIASNAPYLAAVGRLAQLIITGLVFIFARQPDLALRMMVALSVGEILGFAPIAYFAARRLIPAASGFFQLRHALEGVFACGVGAAITWAVIGKFGTTSFFHTSLGLALSLILCGLLIPLFGLNRRGRQRLITGIIVPSLERIGFASKRLRS